MDIEILLLWSFGTHQWVNMNEQTDIQARQKGFVMYIWEKTTKLQVNLLSSGHAPKIAHVWRVMMMMKKKKNKKNIETKKKKKKRHLLHRANHHHYDQVLATFSVSPSSSGKKPSPVLLPPLLLALFLRFPPSAQSAPPFRPSYHRLSSFSLSVCRFLSLQLLLMTNIICPCCTDVFTWIFLPPSLDGHEGTFC